MQFTKYRISQWVERLGRCKESNNAELDNVDGYDLADYDYTILCKLFPVTAFDIAFFNARKCSYVGYYYTRGINKQSTQTEGASN